jgi:hypothetical protein
MTRLAYTADEKAVAVSIALEHGVRFAAAETGVNRHTLRMWRSRRNRGLALNATPQKNPRRTANERPVSPPLPPGVSLTDQDGRIKTPRSLFISLARADGWWFADRSGITPALARRRDGYAWKHIPVAAFAIIERVNADLGEPKWRECVALVPNYAQDQQAPRRNHQCKRTSVHRATRL